VGDRAAAVLLKTVVPVGSDPGSVHLIPGHFHAYTCGYSSDVSRWECMDHCMF